jgi:hypothetical protein
MTGPRTDMTTLPVVDPAAVAPLRDGKPDLYNHMPTRFVPLTEAKERGWTFFYVGESCRWGHVAPRYVSNPRLCVDCHRIKDGRQPIGAKGNKEYSGSQKAYAQRKSKPGEPTVTPVIPRPLEPDALEKKFLVEYAQTRNFAVAAINCGRTEAEFLGRLSYDKIFREAVNQLEADLGLDRTMSMNEDFEWTDDKRNVLLRMYINTGDLAKAMLSIGVSNYHYELEMESNPEFRADMERAEQLAWRHLDRHAIGNALSGDSRLLQRVLAAKLPEQYSDRVKLDANLTTKLTDDQLNSQLVAVYERLGGLITVQSGDASAIDAEFALIAPERKAEAPRNDENPSAANRKESNLDLV